MFILLVGSPATIITVSCLANITTYCFNGLFMLERTLLKYLNDQQNDFFNLAVVAVVKFLFAPETSCIHYLINLLHFYLIQLLLLCSILFRLCFNLTLIGYFTGMDS